MAEAEKLWGTLGGIEFRPGDSPGAFSSKRSTNYDEIERLSQKPILQNTGDSLDTLTLAFKFSAGWCNPNESLQRLQEAMATKEPLFLEFGGGRFAEWWVIDEVSVNVTDTLPTGEIYAMSVSVGLTETEAPEEPEPVLITNPFLDVRAA